MLLSILFVSQIISHLSLLIKQQADLSRIREQRTATMHLLSKKLARTRGIKPLLTVLVNFISDVFNSQTLALLPNQNHQLITMTGQNNELHLTAKEKSVAQWVYELGQIAGLGTQTLPDNKAIYVPLLGSEGALGVLRILPKDPNQFQIPEQLHLLEGFCSQTAMALEVDRLQGEANNTKIQIEANKVRDALLKSVSDNMHVPLMDIMNSANHVIEKGYQSNSLEIQGLGNNIYDHAKDLNHLINKVSQITHLETSQTTPIKKSHSITTLNKIINSAIKSLGNSVHSRAINVHLPSSFPKIYFNKIFLEKVFFNIIENAAKYTPSNTPIDISIHAEEAQNRVCISIEDCGPGLALEEINKIFEKFYRGQAITNIKGMGLGLTICQKIIHLHGGEIWAENRPQGGARFNFTLPLLQERSS
jgi:two-component system sensor histidine kinase KdpD